MAEQQSTIVDLKGKLKKMLVEQLRLKLAPEEIADDVPLVGEGLALDSIDVLEMSVAVEKTFGVEIRSETDARTAFQSVNALAGFIEQRQKV